jgi:glycosyltransferase involved in cell wall biosynthesis
MVQHIKRITNSGDNPLTELVGAAFDQAMAGEGKLSSEVAALEGMSGRKYRLFINNLIGSLTDPRYLEIGVWQGATFCSAIYGNEVRALAIDNWAQFQGPYEKFFNNLARTKGAAKVNFLESDFRAVDYSAIGKFNVYFFDGPHQRKDQFDALVLAQPALDDWFVLIVDDWNWSAVREGTLAAVAQTGLALEYVIEVMTSLDGSQPEVRNAASEWHNGYLIAACSKVTELASAADKPCNHPQPRRSEAAADRPGPGSVRAAGIRDLWGQRMVALPRVSVIISSYNYAQYIETALDSVAAQSYPNLECIVIDDASQDDSVRVVENWLARINDLRFRLITRPANGGQLSAIADGLAATEGEFVAILDADDLWRPEFLQRHVQVHLNTRAAAAASSSHMAQIDMDGRFLAGTANWQDLGKISQQGRLPIAPTAVPRLSWLGADWPSSELPEATLISPDLFLWHWSATSAMMFRRSMLDLVMPADPGSVRICADHYLMVLCHFFAGSFVLEEVLGAYRRHGRNAYAALPVLSSQAALAPYHGKPQLTQNFAVMRDHVIDRYGTFAAIFGDHVPRKFVGEVKSYLAADARQGFAKRSAVSRLFRGFRRSGSYGPPRASPATERS